MKLNQFLFAILLFSFHSIVAQNKNIEKAVIKTILHCDHCKQCETCGKNFNTELYKIKGLKTFELNDTAMTITVYYNPKKTNLQTIKNKISAMGYDADDIKADAVAYENLDNCCKIK
ncbi:hypothetical protein [Flavobacterium sp.]|uniref:hypothetical protein n=1 Tax=Flavobacterium sp. TaxID=239 RepID=UPI0024883B47|nr:hypothetical protein [Flavobacterium sp.]MDI1316496.1 hypothetical protein [Flavobacterium sp.]